MKNKDIIKNLKIYLEENNFSEIDELLHEIYSEEIEQQQMEKISDILDETTLYLELKQQEHKQEALKQISNFNLK